MSFNERWAPYISVANRKANAEREAERLSKKGKPLLPVAIKSYAISTSFWGLAWCKNLEIYADWANRMPRGRSYARNGSIMDLQIDTGKITALVSGSSLYKIKISIDPLKKEIWQAIRSDCAQQVSSLLDLMRGKLPNVVLGRLTDPKKGIFPSPKELKMQCSCPDYATMCKHIAATLYGVGHLLDSEPELFFKMRGVDQAELVADAMTNQACSDAIGLDQESDLAGEDLSALFGIELATTSDASFSLINPKQTKAPAKQTRNAKSKANPTLQSAPSKKASASTFRKRASKKAKPNSDFKNKTSKENSSATNPTDTPRSKPRKIRIDSEANQREAITTKSKKPKAKPTTKAANISAVGSRKKKAAYGNKPRKQSTKKAKR